ncbi:MAG: Crp/Fnr family transcriptional regulator [Geminicoccaceae bacterium]
MTRCDFQAVAPSLRTVDLSRGAMLVEPGVPLDHVWFPHDCVVSLATVLSDGTAADAAIMGREGMVGFMSALGNGQGLGCCVARIGGKASRLDRQRFLELIDTRSSLRSLCLRYAGAFLAQVLQSVACNAHHPVEARLARCLLALQDRASRDDLPVTHDFLAHMLGNNRSTITQTARLLQEQGLIDQRRGVLAIRHRAGLEAAACECYRTTRDKLADLLLPPSHISTGLSASRQTGLARAG